MDLEKAFDHVQRVIWRVLKKCIVEREVKAIMEMYNAVKTDEKLRNEDQNGLMYMLESTKDRFSPLFYCFVIG